MYDMLSSVFTDALNREGKVVTAYKDNTPYNVIFRRNKDTNNTKDRLTIFYPLSANIYTGQLLLYSNKTYIVLNQETAENSVYYKSDLLQTNAKIINFKDNKQYSTPAYAGDINSAIINSGTTISVQSGNIEMITEYNIPNITAITGAGFFSIGQYWKLNNLINKNGILYIYSTVTTKPSSDFSVSIAANDSYNIGDIISLTSTAKYGDMVINNADISWSIDDTNIASISTNGTLTCNKSGTVNVTATWNSQNVSVTKAIAIAIPTNYTLSITADDSYKTSDTPTLTVIAKANNTVVTSPIITWTSSNTSIATIDNTGKVTFLAAGTVTFNATWTEHSVTANKTITVTMETSYILTINNTSPVNINTDIQLSVTAMKNGIDVTNDSIYSYSFISSDESIATITDTTINSVRKSYIKFSKVGTVIITAKWRDVGAGVYRATTTKEISGQETIKYVIGLTSPYSPYGTECALGKTTVATAYMKNSDTGEKVTGNWHFVFTNIKPTDNNQIVSWKDNGDGTCNIQASSALSYNDTYFEVFVTETTTNTSVNSGGHIAKY